MTTGPGQAPKVAVGSRAEAKALKEAALRHSKEREKALRHRERSSASRERVDRLHQADDAEGRAGWDTVDAVAVLVVMAASLAGSSALLGSEGLALMPTSGQYVSRAIVLGVFHLLQLALLGYLSARHRLRLRAAFGLGRLGRGAASVALTAGAVALLLVATRAFATLWGMTSRALGWKPPVTGEIIDVFGAGGLGLVVAIAIVVLLGPFVEELAFRGVILRAVGDRFGMWPAIVGSAAMFALYHFSAWGFVPLFALGLAAGWLAWTRRTIWGAIALHALYNGVVVGAAYWLAR